MSKNLLNMSAFPRTISLHDILQRRNFYDGMMACCFYSVGLTPSVGGGGNSWVSNSGFATLGFIQQA